MMIHTNYCGPYWNDGKIQSSQRKFSKIPVSKEDIYCMIHDYTYALCDGNERCQRKADVEFIRNQVKLNTEFSKTLALGVASNFLPNPIGYLPLEIYRMVQNFGLLATNGGNNTTPPTYSTRYDPHSGDLSWLPEWMHDRLRLKNLESVNLPGDRDVVYVPNIGGGQAHILDRQVKHDETLGRPINLVDPRFMFRRRSRKKRSPKQNG